MSKEEILEEITEVYKGMNETVMKALIYDVADYLDRYAMHIVEQSVPKYAQPDEDSAEGDYIYGKGFTSCQEQTLETARNLTSNP